MEGIRNVRVSENDRCARTPLCTLFATHRPKRQPASRASRSLAIERSRRQSQPGCLIPDGTLREHACCASCDKRSTNYLDSQTAHRTATKFPSFFPAPQQPRHLYQPASQKAGVLRYLGYLPVISLDLTQCLKYTAFRIWNSIALAQEPRRLASFRNTCCW